MHVPGGCYRLPVVRSVLFHSLAAAAVTLLSCGCTKPRSSEHGCRYGGADDREVWKSLATVFQECLLTRSPKECRTEIEAEEWVPISPATAESQELHGTIAPGGASIASPGRAPEGDMCLSHDDIDWNWNVYPAAASAGLLQPGNLAGDADHPPGVIEGEWEGFFLDPSYVAMPAGAQPNYKTWGSPNVDMQIGDTVALRGAGVLDCGHAPYRGELHPPYLALWGGLRGSSLVAYVRATANLTRPSDFRSLAEPPQPEEKLAEDFSIPPPPASCPLGATPVLQLTTAVDWFYDTPTIVIDHGCDLSTGVLVGSQSAAFDVAVASPAAHLVGTSDPASASTFFSVAAELAGDHVHIAVTPLDRSRQALFGARVTANWSCP